MGVIIVRDNETLGGPSLSPSLIVGIFILAGIFVCVLIASVAHLCTRLPSSSADDPPDNLFRPYSQDQVERMREVRWLNHSAMWEQGRMARMEMGEQFGPKPRFNRRTGVGWGFTVGQKSKGDVSEEDAWSSQGNSSGSRKMTMTGQQDPAQQYLRPQVNLEDYRESYYTDCDPYHNEPHRQGLPQAPSNQQLYQAYQPYIENAKTNENGDEDVTEPVPESLQIPGFEQRFSQDRKEQRVLSKEGGGKQVRMVRNESGDVSQGEFVGGNTGTVVRKPMVPLNDGKSDIISRNQDGFTYGDGYGTGRSIEMQDLGEPHAR